MMNTVRIAPCYVKNVVCIGDWRECNRLLHHSCVSLPSEFCVLVVFCVKRKQEMTCCCIICRNDCEIFMIATVEPDR